MKKRRLAAGVMAAVMAAGIVAGCSSTGAGAKGSQEEKVTIKVALWDYSNTEYYKTMFDAFTAKYPILPLNRSNSLRMSTITR